MFRNLLATLLLCCCAQFAFGQTGFDYANAWFNATQTYAKVLVWEDGVYRVDAAALGAGGLNVAPGDIANLQVFYRGQQQHVYVKTSSGNLDYVEFYGMRNDGRVDSILYRDPYTRLHDGEIQPNKNFSTFSDTSAYFFTIGAQPGLRYSNFSDLNFGNYSPEPHFRYQSYYDYHPNSGFALWNYGGGSQYDIFHILNSYYVTAEGYVGQEFDYNAPATVVLPTKYAANVGNPSELECRIYGRSSWVHVSKITMNGQVMVNDTIAGIFVRTWNRGFSNALTNNTTVLYEALGNQNSNTDNNNVLYTKVTYDHLFNMDGQNAIMVHDWQQNSNAYFNFVNADTGSIAIAYDLTTHTRCEGVAGGNAVQVVVPGGGQARKIFVATNGAIKTPLVEQPRLSNLSDPGAGASFVIIAHRSLAASANAYKQYRDTCTLNPQTAKVVFTDEIYDEFGSGTITPLAIKRFCKYAIDNWTTKPKYFMLWGKGQYITRNSTVNLVPTFGYPANDYDFVSDFDQYQIDVVPQASIGRVNVYNDADGLLYLAKANEYEHTPWTPWMKESVYLGGGNDTTEQKPIFDYLLSYKDIWEAPPLGGHGNYYQKYNTGELTNSSMTSTERINAGANIINFFGHSSNNIYDVDIQEPSLYLNYGKYPMMIAFGCYGGNFTGDLKSFGERFVLSENRGSIGYLANSTAGYLTPLGNFGEKLYPQVCDSSYGLPFGDQVRRTIRDYASIWTDQVYTNHAKQMNLQGDPSISLYHPEKPDLEITMAGLFFTPYNFSAADSFFTLNVIVHNYGLVTADSFYLSVRQQLPSGTWLNHSMTKHAPVVSVDTLEVLIHNTFGSEMAGLNLFDIFADSTDLVDEYREDNNRLQMSAVIPGNAPAVLFPYDFAVIDTPNVRLSASALIMSRLATVRYIFEIDTVPTFNSPRYIGSPVVVGSAIYSEWDVPFTLVDSTVYYWRVRLADAFPDAWAKASFKYIAQRTGWAQSRPPQFYTDPTVQVTMNQTVQEWGFDQWSSDLHAYTSAGGHAVYRLANGAYFSEYPSTNGDFGIKYTPIRAKDLKPSITSTIHGDWAYASMPAGQNAVVSAIASLEKGDYFLAVSEQDPRVEQWAPHVRAAFALIGCDTSLLNNFAPGNALVVLGRKDYPGQGILLTNPNVFDEPTQTWQTDLRKAMQSNFATGAISSTTVGPAVSWRDLVWNWSTVDPFIEEDTRVSLYVSHDGVTDSLVFQNLTRGSYSLSNIDAEKYPFIKLKAALKDSAFLTAPQLQHWHVIYTPAPDAVIDPISLWSFDHDTVTQGENVTVKYAARNITETDMDSLLVRYIVQLEDRRTVEVGHKRFGRLLAGQRVEHTFTFSTNFPDMVGNVSFNVELNPFNDQPEQYHFNNLYSYPFKIRPDEINPILDVTVDGKHLMDGDIVSPLPEILIQMNDENRHLAVNDTAFEIHFGLKTPNPANLPRIFIAGNSQIQIESASLPANKAKLHFKPGHLVDGEYTLRVQGFDQNGNQAGKTDYEINFKVVNEVAISNLLNYPNPFSTSTRFVYTLTGAEIPERFDIQIFTITGKLVKVIDLHETNDVKVGYNITDYAWDGRDEYGDLLANGVYIYKVVAKVNGKDMKLRDEGITDLFKNGFGKMYLMR
ncbi:MAG: hypothetical protein KA239_05200 [Bacteroidia bacterium]|nr:hypothetical protein [Bacteroidia bacterium]